MKKIYIIGAGAIGKALAVILKDNKQEVVLVRSSKTCIPPYQEKIIVKIEEKNIIQSIEQIGLSELPDDGIYIVSSKAFANAKIAQECKHLKSLPFLLLQNGLEVETAFIKEGYRQLMRGVLFSTSQQIDQSLIRFKPVKASPIGMIKGDQEILIQTAIKIQNEYFPFEISTDIERIVWKKTILNTVFNSLCPILEIDNGIYHRDQEVLRFAEDMMQTCLLIAAQKGIEFSLEELKSGLVEISKFSDGQDISTWQDIKNGRPTEIQFMNHVLVKYAKECGLEKQVTTIEILGKLIEMKSKIHLKTV